MKRAALFILIGIISLSLSCGKGKNSSSAPTSTPNGGVQKGSSGEVHFDDFIIIPEQDPFSKNTLPVSKIRPLITDSPDSKTLVINLEEVSNEYIVSLTIEFDPEKYSPKAVAQGDLFGSDDDILLFALLNKAGYVPAAVARLNPDQKGYVSGSGELLEIVFDKRPQQLTKLIQKAPTPDPGNTITIVGTPNSLTWNEARWGDWNNDGAVSAVDIAPLALNFGDSSNPGDPNYYQYATYIDGNGDGFINAGDLSPVAFHFGESTVGYVILQSDDANGANEIPVAFFPRPSVPDDPNNPPTNKSFATLTYDTSTLTPPWVPINSKYYRVFPTDVAGISPTPPGLVSNYFQYTGGANAAPTAAFTANPPSGNAPLTVTFDASASNDPDGTIALYEWDFEGDGTYDQQGASLITPNFIYNIIGDYNATLRVTDNLGATGTYSQLITVTQAGNIQPIANLVANPTSGQAPLTVDFDASLSTGVDDAIVSYEWDFQGDGSFGSPTTVPTAQYTYDIPGSYNATLRVTDEGNLKATASVMIDVQAPPNTPPSAVNAIDVGTGTAPLTVNFDGIQSIDPDGAIVSYQWQAWDGGGNLIWDDTNTTGSTSRTFTTIGPYNVALTVTDDKGATDRADVFIVVYELTISTVDSQDDPGFWNSIAQSPAALPVISYRRETTGQLTVASYDGTNWTVTPVDVLDNSGAYSSVAVDGSGNIHVSYYDQGNGDLKYAKYNGIFWDVQTIDSNGDVGKYTSIGIVPASGNIFVSYYDETNGDLKVAIWNGTWNPETVDSTGDCGLWTSLIVDSADTVHISYYEQTNGDLRHAYRPTGLLWFTEGVDSTGDCGSGSSFRVDSTGLMNIAYTRAPKTLAFAWYESNTWQTMDMPTADTGLVGVPVSMYIPPDNMPIVAYYETGNSDLRGARWNGYDMDYITLDSTGDVGSYPAVTMIDTGGPGTGIGIAYRDASSMALKYAFIKVM